jgi:hypothetical protein
MPQIYISKYLWEKIREQLQISDIKTLVEALLVEMLESQSFREQAMKIYAGWKKYMSIYA